MAESFLHSYPELKSFLLQNVQLTGETIGNGSYGSVVKVVMPGATCAAKRIHDALLDAVLSADSTVKPSDRFVQECQLMSNLRHPHIVQFLGLCFLPGSQFPALVMELLMTSLHDLIVAPPPKDAPEPHIPLDLQVSILYDVSSGLAYLHTLSPPIIHRDLSARNVLLSSGMVAKIADMGMARIVPDTNKAATMTKGPGAIIYMPPEAIESKSNDNKEEKDKKSKYGSSIDIFSLGVIAIFTLSQTFPCDLLSPTYRNNGRLLARTELERREKYMRIVYKQLCKKHPLIRMIESCLDFPEKRPIINEVIDLLQEARAEVRAGKSDMSKLDLVLALSTKQGELMSRLHDLEDLEQKLQTRKEESEDKSRELTEALNLLTLKDEQLQHSERDKRRLQTQLQQKERELRMLEERIRISEAQQQLNQKINVQCHERKRVPVEIVSGSVTTDGQYAYCNPRDSYSLYQYEYTTEKWETLPQCQYENCGLAIVENELTTVGGERKSRFSNKLITLQHKVWVEKLPLMKTSRSHPAVVTTTDGDYLFVIGGVVAGGFVGNWCGTIEILHLKTKIWYTTTNLPESPPTFPSAIICSGNLNVIGDGNNVYSCSLQHMPSTDQPISPPPTLAWTSLPHLPVNESMAATLHEQLIIVGGRNFFSVNSIHQLVNGQWVKIGSMTHKRERCLVVNQSRDKILIVGGHRANCSIEECFVI